MPADFPLPLRKPSPGSVDPWRVEQQPTTLFGFWPGDAPPTKTEVVSALQCHWQLSALEQVDELDGAMWNGVFTLPNITSPVIIWAEPAKPLRPGELNDPHAESRKWVIGFETMLDCTAPIDEYATLLRALAGGLGCTTVLDPSTQRYWQRQALADLTCEYPSELSAEDLWTIQAVMGENEDRHGALWLHTHGLWRCGRPELEMLEVPREHGNAAARLMNEIAEFSFHAGLAAPGEVMEVGRGLSVTVHPWQEIAPQVDSVKSGGMDDRDGEDNAHAGVRAVICAAKPRGLFRKIWHWPEEAVRAYQTDDAIMYRTTEQSMRQELLAREKWDELAMAFTGAKDRSIACLIKAVFTDNPDRREHLWLEIQRFEGGKAYAKVVSHPLRTSGPRHGDVCPVQRDMITDWAVQTPHGRFGPQHVPAMRRSIRLMKEQS